MKKLSNILLAGLALVAAVSCNKENAPVEEPQQNAGVPMTLTATIGGPETKLTMAEDGNVLKSTWDASEKITVITYTGTGWGARVQTIDTFTYSGAAGQTSVDFTGTFTGDAANKILVIYPALEYDSVKGDYRSASGLIYGVKKEADGGNSYIYFNYWDGSYTQTANADPSFLKDNPLTGEGTVSGGALSVDLKPLFGVLKMTLTLPAEADGETLYGVCVTTTTGGSSIFRKTGNDSSTSIQNFGMGSFGSTGMMALNGATGIAVPADRKLVCYMPFCKSFSSPSFGTDGITSLKVDVSYGYYYAGILWSQIYTATKTLSASPAIPAETGKMYRLELDF